MKKMELETVEPKIVFYPFKGSESISAVYSFEKRSKYFIPFYLSPVSAGFPSPADDYIESKLDLNDLLVQHPAATFFTRVNGSSMIEAGIFHDDLLVVDRSETPGDGCVVVAVVDGELTVKRLRKIKGKVFLYPENPDYQPIEIKEDTQFEIWGVVIAVIHRRP
jgi:DNA polymerase V